MKINFIEDRNEESIANADSLDTPTVMSSIPTKSFRKSNRIPDICPLTEDVLLTEKSKTQSRPPQKIMRSGEMACVMACVIDMDLLRNESVNVAAATTVDFKSDVTRHLRLPVCSGKPLSRLAPASSYPALVAESTFFFS